MGTFTPLGTHLYFEKGVDNFESFVYNVCVRYNERGSCIMMAESRMVVHTHTHRWFVRENK